MIAALISSELAPDNASGPWLTIFSHSSQSTGAAASVADVEIPDTIPGARLGLTAGKGPPAPAEIGEGPAGISLCSSAGLVIPVLTDRFPEAMLA